MKESPSPIERIGFLDIEASNLDADFGIMLSYAIKDSLSNTIYEGVLRKSDISKAKTAGNEDARLVAACIKDMYRFDRIVTWYGRKFDVPYIRTRALIDGVPFPGFGTLVHTDAYYMARFRLKLSSNRLENVCRNILGKTQKTRILNHYWRGAQRGDKASLEYVLDHNRKDVLDLEKIYNKLCGFVSKTKTSL